MNPPLVYEIHHKRHHLCLVPDHVGLHPGTSCRGVSHEFFVQWDQVPGRWMAMLGIDLGQEVFQMSSYTSGDLKELLGIEISDGDRNWGNGY